ncbi:GNAT family N-acetyltransferase [Ruania halotolerans]|uniref:GNAT family N-acetyltransferase n=1 Tax=Ruania halotolerans TaxID=2897773 RepID=UPI001E2D0FCD|nr:GNAT family N-acetyltransferase [Ruania halotolerans]UFU07691.1 GNAT family N-acetyltransferase [Ruania halotolerans]
MSTDGLCFRAGDDIPHEDIVAILGDALGGQGAAHHEAVQRLVATSTAFVLVDETGTVAAAAGCPSKEGWTIRAIAVVQGQRRRGLGTELVERLSLLVDGPWLLAETDSDSVGFYRGCGFDVTNLGEVYPGVERFACQRRI